MLLLPDVLMHFLFAVLRRKNYAWKSVELKYCVTFRILFLIYIITKSNESNSKPCMIVTTGPLVQYLLQQPINTFLVLGDRCASSSVSPIKSGAFSFTRKQKKIPAALKEARNYLAAQLSNFSCRENMNWLTFSHDVFFPGFRQHRELLHERLLKQVKRQQEAVEEAVVCH